MKHFYHHIIKIETIHIALSDLDLEPHEKEHLVTIAETNIHHSVIDTVLSELSNEDKKTFLALIAHENAEHSKIWDFLNLKIEQAELKVIKAAEALLKKMHEDIQDVKNK
jgi:hypothetical protein